MPNLNEKLEWTDVDQRAVDTARILAADAVEKVGSGHPGTAMSLAPVAYLLFQKVMNQDPGDDRWQGRDRFILSPGHTSLTLYTQLFLGGYGLEMGDLESLRTWGALTPGTPNISTLRAWRSPPARSARGWHPPLVSPTLSVTCVGFLTPRPQPGSHP